MSATAGRPETLERDYRAKVAKVRADNSLSWEQKERKVRALGLEYDRTRKEAERRAA